MSFLHPLEGPIQSLCVLGAGNCNDLDLHRLTEAYREVHLVDLDGQALHDAVMAQQAGEREQISVHAGVDVTGLSEWLARWSPNSPPPPEAADEALAVLQAAGNLGLGSHHDVVASVCLLSQLIDSLKICIGEHHCHFLTLVQAVRAQHLRLMTNLLRPGGRAILVTDFVSSVTCRELEYASEGDLPSLTQRCIQARDFFTGLNPFVLQQVPARDAWLSPRVHRVRLSPPWQWQFPGRVYAVCALEFSKRDDM
jgi:hypothetical protein